MYSASALIADGRYGDQYYFLKRQIVWSLLGCAALWCAYRTPLPIAQRWARPALLGVAAALALVLVVGHEVGGARRWLRVGGFGVQPSEFAKLAVVLALADHLDRKQSRLTRFAPGLLPPLALSGAVIGLIAMERDLGTPLLIGAVAVGMIYLAGARIAHLAALGLAVLPLVSAAVLAVPYRRQRLLAFLDPWSDSRGAGYQLVQSLLAIGSGGFWGKGSGESTVKMFYMPESQTDFIFPIFGEEFGFVGAALLTFVFLALTYRVLQIARRANGAFDGLLAAGVGLLLGGQVLINLGVVTGLLPTKGMPLPFVSFGGSSLLALMIGVGLVLNVARRAREAGTPLGRARA